MATEEKDTRVGLDHCDDETLADVLRRELANGGELTTIARSAFEELSERSKLQR